MDMDSLYISGLGSPQISLNGQTVEFKRRKAVALLVYLAVERRSQSREFLSGLFWPEYNQSKAYAYLRRTLWEIKDALGDDLLEVTRVWIGIHSSVNFQTDINQFQELLQWVKDHNHPFVDFCNDCINQLETAIHFYRGDFLSGFSLSGCPQFDDWQFLQSETYRRLYQDSLQNLVNALEQGGKTSEAIPYAQRWLAIDSLDERAHRKLMALYAKNQQRHAALRQFEQCQMVLKTELDLLPELETTELYNQIRTNSSQVNKGQRQVLLSEHDRKSWLDQILASPVQVAYPTNLPRQWTPFVGRQSEISDICKSLEKLDCWLMTLTGMGGIGKTRLAHQVGLDVSATFLDGVYFVSLEGLKSISALAPKIAETLGFSFLPQESSLKHQLTSFLRDKTLLLIFDNFEELISEADMLHQLHAEAANLKFLVTSREPLKISGEWVFEVPGLDFPESSSGPLDQILQIPAVTLFVQAAIRSSNNFLITEDNCRDVVAITRFVEGMPLGLEMAASWVNTLSPGEILSEIRSNLDFLKTEMQDTPERQRSIRAVLDYSWNRLDPKDQSTLAGLSVFQGSFTRESAEKVVGISLPDFKKFIDCSFIRQKDYGRFQLHELQRQYAFEKLLQSPKKHKSARDRHAAYYCVAVSQWGDGLKGPDQVEFLSILLRETENIQAAWVWASTEKQIELIKRGLEGLCYFYLRTLRNHEGLNACQLGLSLLDEVETESESELKANLLAWKSLFCLNLDETILAGESIKAALKMMARFEEKHNHIAPLWARLFTTKAIVENYLGNRESAIEYYDRAFAVYQQLQDFSGFSYLMLRALDTSGVTSAKTYQFLSDAIQFKRKSGDLFNIAYLSYMYCMVVAYHLGQPVQAAALMQESFEIFERLGDSLSKEMSLVAVDPILNTNGRYDELLAVREKKLDYAQERGDRQTTGIYLAEVGENLCHLGKYSSAENHFRKSLLHIREGTPYQYAYRLCCLGEVLLVLGQFAESRDVFQESIDGMKIGEKWGLGKAMAGLSIAAYKLGEKEKAWEIVQQALQYHYEGHTHYFSHFSLGAYAYLLSHQGNPLNGIEIYAMLDKQEFVRNSCWFADLYRDPIYALAVKEGPGDITASESAGKAMDLWVTLERLSNKPLT
jgi:predicted ATPase/DNA-binding SARP family transcriptional activator